MLDGQPRRARAQQRIPATLDLVDLSKRYAGLAAVDGVNLEVHAGEFLTLLGASGSGKTTTLMAVAGFVGPTSGHVRINNVDQTQTPPSRRDIGIVFQHYALFPHLTVERNIAFPLEMRKVAADERRRRVAEALALVRLEGFGTRKPSELSGGQQQRVALARALVYEPSILLLDEPLGALDKNLREEMQVEIRRIQQELRITTISVTHDQQEAIRMSDRIAVMRAGRVEQVGSPADIYERPANRFVASFMGASNFLRAHPIDGGCVRLSNGHTLECPAGLGAGRRDAVDLVIRPERLRVLDLPAAPSQALRGNITSIVYAGDTWLISVTLEDGTMLNAAHANNGPLSMSVGSSVAIDWDPSLAWPVEVEAHHAAL